MKSLGFPLSPALLRSVNRWNSEVDVVFGAVDIAGGIYGGPSLFEVNALSRDGLGDSLSECGDSLL